MSIKVFLCIVHLFFACDAAKGNRSKFQCDGNLCFKEGYDFEHERDIPPSSDHLNGSPVVVNIGFKIDSILSVDSDHNIVGLGITLHQSWIDNRVFPKHKLQKDDWLPIPSRLGRNPETGLSEKIWLPNLYIYSMVKMEVKSNFQDQILMWITQKDNKNHIHYNSQIELYIKCPMKYLRYPFDQHECPIKISSADLSLRKLRFNITNPTEWGRNVNEVGPFNITNLPFNQTELIDVWEGEKWSIAGFKLRLKRRYWQHVFNYYLSSGMYMYIYV